MNATGTYLAVFTGSKDNPRMKEWMALSDADRQTREKAGMAAWNAWMQQHCQSVVGQGGPLGKTKRVTSGGTHDVSNALSGFIVVRADSHEAAAKMFENHPHFTAFPGDGVEVMPILAIPTP